MRQTFVLVHRVLGLATAVFLAVAGLTGSIIAFNHELDEWLNPDLFHAHTQGDPIPPVELAARVEAAEPRLRVTYVPLEVEPGHALVLGVAGRINSETGLPDDIGYDELFLDPVSGARLGQRQWGACCVERKQLLPFIYALHYSLHLPETWGLWVMGAIALGWAVDCFVGFYLTLPPRRRAAALSCGAGPSEATAHAARSPGAAMAEAIMSNATAAAAPLDEAAPSNQPTASFWQRWKPAWRIKRGASAHRINFDLHRAGGLWFWALLLMLAVSGASFNLHFEIFRPVLSLFTTVTPSPFDPARVPQTPPGDPSLSFATAAATARDEAKRRGWPKPFDVFYSQEIGLYGVGFGDHHAPGIGVPSIYLDARTGLIVQESIPGRGPAGDLILQSMFPLHSGQIIGLPGRILISATGLIVALLSVTGVVIWARKRKGRLLAARRVRAAHDSRGREREQAASAEASCP